MSNLAKNISSNLLATGFITILTLAVTPAQIHILGVESYGIIGFIATLQIIFIIFELGLSTTITKYVAEYSSGSDTKKDGLLGTAMSLYWISAFLIGCILLLSSNFIAANWFKNSSIGAINLESSFIAISCYLAIRWPISFYSGVLIGMRKINISNTLKVIATSIRLLGGLLILFFFPDLEIFLWWMVFSGALEVFSYVILFKKISISRNWKFKVSIGALMGVWKFSVSMSAISILGLIISQLDRIIGSKMLTLEDFGYYSIAYSAASVISLIVTSISSAIFPYFSFNQGNQEVLIRQYKYANEIMIFCIGFAVFPFVFYGDVILRIWAGGHVEQYSYLPLALLSIGFWCSAALSNAANLTTALGKPGVTLKLSALSAVPYATLLYYLLRNYGLNGAAFGWMVLNFIYLIILTLLVNKYLLKISTFFYSIKTMGPLLLLGCIIFLFSRALTSYFFHINQIALLIPMLLSLFLYAFFGYRLLDRGIRIRFIIILSQYNIARFFKKIIGKVFN